MPVHSLSHPSRIQLSLSHSWACLIASQINFSFMCLLDCFTNYFLHHFSLQFCVCQKLSFHGFISFLFLFWVIYLPSTNPQKTHDVLFHFLICSAHHQTS
jgi:hypothetical protein